MEGLATDLLSARYCLVFILIVGPQSVLCLQGLGTDLYPCGASYKQTARQETLHSALTHHHGYRWSGGMTHKKNLFCPNESVSVLTEETRNTFSCVGLVPKAVTWLWCLR